MYIRIPRVVEAFLEREPKATANGRKFFERIRDDNNTNLWIGRLHVVMNTPQRSSGFEVSFMRELFSVRVD